MRDSLKTSVPCALCRDARSCFFLVFRWTTRGIVTLSSDAGLSTITVGPIFFLVRRESMPSGSSDAPSSERAR